MDKIFAWFDRGGNRDAFALLASVNILVWLIVASLWMKG